MQIKEVMSDKVEVIGPDETIAEAASKMAQDNIGFLPVCDGDRIVGTVTDRDITVRATAGGMDPKGTRVRDVMSEKATWCFDDDEIDRVRELMTQKQIRRLIVVNRSKRLVGIVALGDLAREEKAQSGDVLESVSKSPPNN